MSMAKPVIYYPRQQITGVILAGGRARRMGGQDKGLVHIGARPMVSYILEVLRPQVGTVLINANRNQAEYASLGGCPVFADDIGDFAGPLAGMAGAMRAAATPFVLTLPCDSPLPCPDLAARLFAALERDGAELSVAHDGERLQPVFALLDCRLRDDLYQALTAGERKIDAWYAKHNMAQADFSDVPEMFLNVNTPEDHARMEQRLTETP